MANKSVPPKGKVKGGARFPRHSLEQALPWIKKLVSKTHGGPMPADMIMAGVVEAKGPRGEIKISALRQFDLIEGDTKGYSHTSLAKKIAHAPEDELPALLKQAALTPTLFKNAFDTFQGDQVSISKIRQRFAELNVHPDNAGECVEKYVETLEFAKLGVRVGDDFRHASPSEESREQDGLEIPEEDRKYRDDQQDSGFNQDYFTEPKTNHRAAIQISVNLDSSLDTEKLERQLMLLKKYGAI